ASAMSRSRSEVSRAELVVLVLDASRSLEEQSELMAAYSNALRVVNKSDRALAWAESVEGIRTVGTTGQGIDSLRREIVKSLCREHPIDIHRARCWTERQRAELRKRLM
ncbi:MAG TPA: hypothetical protein VLJ39_07980, partial [Tepidisphaeraceae bacterium]|nr:hypothetical protein [Tepidisphaeraceae bacterium]